MIHITGLRNGRMVKLFTGDRTAKDALAGMVIYELGFGGAVIELEPTKVVVETIIFGGTKDTTIFEGSQEEMAFLVSVAAHHCALMGDEESRGILVKSMVDFWESLPKEVGGLPIYVAMTAPMLMGNQSASAALLIAAGLKDPEAIRELVPIRLEDLVAAVELHRETGRPITEIVREFSLKAA